MQPNQISDHLDTFYFEAIKFVAFRVQGRNTQFYRQQVVSISQELMEYKDNQYTGIDLKIAPNSESEVVKKIFQLINNAWPFS
jgi:predicted PolB exonuclease-like 3'-5' exonuclease